MPALARVAHVGDGRAEHLVVLHVFTFQPEIHFLAFVGRIAEHLADPVGDGLQVVGHQQHRVVFLHPAGVFFVAVDDHLENAVFFHRHIETAVLVAAAGAHARQ